MEVFFESILAAVAGFLTFLEEDDGDKREEGEDGNAGSEEV